MPRKDFLFALWLVFSAFASCSKAKGKKWVVILSAAKGYPNYAAQSDTCHAYHAMRNGGIPASNIIHFNYDDVAHAPDNPFPNNLVNIAEGLNVYPGCEIDYRKDEVTPEVFMNVMTGNKTTVKELIGREGKVLESGPDDHVFLTMDDHGSPGIFHFPGPTMKIHAHELQQMLRTMHEKKLYKKMLIYMESCFSGSMFKGLLPDDMNIYAVTASNATELAWMCCYDELRKVSVGGLFYNTWTYTVDEADRDSMTLKHLYEKEKIAGISGPYPSASSHPKEFGDLSLRNMTLSEFMGSVKNKGVSRHSKRTENAPRFKPENKEPDVPEFLRHPAMDMVGIATAMRRLMSKDLTYEKRRELKRDLELSLKVKKASEELFKDIAGIAAQVEPTLSPEFFFQKRDTVENYLCYKEALDVVTSRCPIMDPSRYPFIGRNFYVLINACNKLGIEAATSAINKAASNRKECGRI